MFWVQIVLSFGLWIGAGVVMMQRSANLRSHAFGVKRSARIWRTVGLFIASPLGIFLPLVIIARFGGLLPDRLLASAWLLVTFGGLACVGAGTLALAYAVSLAIESAAESRVTTDPSPASSMKDSSDR